MIFSQIVLGCPCLEDVSDQDGDASLRDEGRIIGLGLNSNIMLLVGNTASVTRDRAIALERGRGH